MKLEVSKEKVKGYDREKHLVLRCEKIEGYYAYSAIKEQVTNGVEPYKEVNRQKLETIFRFDPRYLDSLLLTFPQAEIAEPIHRWLAKRELKKIEDWPVPNLVIPNLKGKLKDYQKIGVEYGVQKLKEHGAFFLHDSMGIGKTPQALCITRIMGAYPCLVVCPNSLKWNWAEEIEKWFPKLTYQIIDGTKTQKSSQATERVHFTICGYDALKTVPELQSRKWRMKIADEHQAIKSNKTARTKAFLKTKAEHKLYLTGTPILNGRIEELWPPLYDAFPKEVPEHFWFMKRYSIPGKFGPVAYKNLHEVRDFLHDRSLRRRQDQVLKELPPVTPVVRNIEMNTEQQEIYNTARDDLRLKMENGEFKNIQSALVAIGRLNQICFSPELYGGSKKSAKIDEVKELVSEITRSGNKVLIFTQWEKGALILKRELAKYKPAYMSGKVAPKERWAEKEKFQKDPNCKVFIGTIKTMKEGWNLTAATYVIFMDEDWVPGNNQQAWKRAHRIGTTKPITVIFLHAENTVEDKKTKLLEWKEAMNNAITERDRGKELIKFKMTDIKELLK